MTKYRLPSLIKSVSAREGRDIKKSSGSAQMATFGGFSVTRNQLVTVLAVVIVAVAAYFGAYYISKNATTRNELTQEEKNLAQQLDKSNSDTPTPDQNPFQPADQNNQPTHESSGSYLVKQGDTLSAIAASYTGDGAKWPDLAQANAITDPKQLKPGQELKIPASYTNKTPDISQDQPPKAAAVPAENTSASYTVVRSDTLWSIAQKYYGSGFEWYKIRDANPGKITVLSNGKPGIEIGTQLSIPLAAASSLK